MFHSGVGTGLGNLDFTGLNQAITLAQDSLTNVKFVQEKKVIGRFFEQISDINYVVPLMGKGDSFHAEVGVND